MKDLKYYNQCIESTYTLFYVMEASSTSYKLNMGMQTVGIILKYNLILSCRLEVIKLPKIG